MKRVALIYLPHPYLNQPDAQAPLGLLYLASVLKKDYDVKLYNFACRNTHEAIAELGEHDVYGISITSLELLQANRFAHLIKERFPGAKVILGGPGTISDEYVDWNIIDSICKGEGEITILEMLRDADNNNLKKIYYGILVQDLDVIEFPSRDLIENQGGNIFAYNENYVGNGSSQILTSRGCPFKCAFCSASYLTSKIRYRTTESVVAEIKQVISDYGIKQFRFADETFVLKKGRLKKLCEQIKSLDIIWRISTRVDIFSEETGRMLVDAGCREVSFGCESFDDDVLKILNKKTTAEINARALEASHRAGLKTRCMLMIRTPGQTKDTVRLNIEWLSRVPYDIICCTTFIPIPGCDIWYHPEKYNIQILNKNLDDYNFYFFGGGGENEIKDIIKLDSMDMDELNQQTIEFRQWVKETGKINEG